MKIFRALSALLLFLLPALAYGQLTAVTGTGIRIGGHVIPSGSVCAVAVDQFNNPISVSIAGSGMRGVGQSCAAITAGAITGNLSGGGTYELPDEALAGNPGFFYTFTITDTQRGSTTFNQSFQLVKVPNITGSTFALDRYVPTISVPTVAAFTFTTGSGAPTGACSGKAFYQNIVTPSAPVLYQCGSDSGWHLIGSASGGVADPGGNGIMKRTALNTTAPAGASDLAAALAAQAGCTTAGNAWNPATNTCVAPTGTTPLPVAVSRGTNYFFGDSTMVGTGATTNANSLASYMASDLLGPSNNQAIIGNEMWQIAGNIYQVSPTPSSTGVVAKVFSNGGINDANDFGTSAGDLNNYTMELNAVINYVENPNRVCAAFATLFGFGVPDATFFPGCGIQSVTAGDRLFQNASSSTSKIGLTWGAQASSTGTFQFLIDGVAQTFLCTGTTTFTGQSCGASHSGINRQEFTVTPGSHTSEVLVLTAGASPNSVTILFIDDEATTKVGQNVFFMSGVPKEQSDTASAATAAYDAAAKAVVAQLAGDNQNVYFADMRLGTPGINSTTDYAVGGGCPGGAPPLHLNNCGYLHWAQTFESAASAAHLNLFFPGFGSTLSTPWYDATTTVGTGNGTGGFVFANHGSTNESGSVQISTGTSPSASSVVGTVVWLATLSVPESCGLDAQNPATAAIIDNLWVTGISPTGFTINVGATPLAASTAYLVGYRCK